MAGPQHSAASRFRSPRLELGAALLAIGCATPKVGPSVDIRSDPRVHAAVERARVSSDAPGFAAVVVKGDQAFMGVSGHRTHRRERRVTVRDRWHIGSVTKMMTASLVARLVEGDRLHWDTTLGEMLGAVVPEMKAQYRTATLRHVLAHRTGLRLNRDEFADRMSRYTQEFLRKNGASGPPPIGFKDGDFTGDPVVDRLHWTQAALQEPPAAPLGAPKRLYENGNYVVMATVMEQLTGSSWEELMKAELFQPLSMIDAGFGPPGVRGHVTDPYGHRRSGDGTVTPFPPEGPVRPDNPPVIGPSGRVHVSLDDMARFMRDHIAGHLGKPALLSPKTYRVLHTPPFGDDYALGWIRRKSGGLGHGGTNGKWLALVEIRPKDELGVFVVTNLGPPAVTAPAAEQLMTELFELFGS